MEEFTDENNLTSNSIAMGKAQVCIRSRKLESGELVSETTSWRAKNYKNWKGGVTKNYHHLDRVHSRGSKCIPNLCMI